MGTLYRRQDSPKWYGEYTDSSGKRRQRSTGTNNKRDAGTILAKWESEANMQRHGLTISAAVTLESLLTEYVTYLGSTTPRYQEEAAAKIRRVLDALTYTYPREIDRIQVENVVRTLKTPKGEPLSLRTQSHYLTAIKGFTRWLTQLRGALVRDPLAAIKKPNFERDRKKRRRFLTQAEWYWLARTPNALIYETAIATGLRASELRSLTRASLRVDHLHLDAKHTKNGKVAKQYISADLRQRLASALPFRIPDKSAKLFYADLELARAAWLASKPDNPPVDFLAPLSPSGECLDFHALRHTCGAWLAIAGVSIKVIQSVMRHSTITLTLDTYGHLLPGAEQDAAGQLSVLLTQASAAQHPQAAPKPKSVTAKKRAKPKKKPTKP